MGVGAGSPIGDNNNPFFATFEGNGYVISNLAIRRNQPHVGMFSAFGNSTSAGDIKFIRNIGLVSNLADYTGNSGNNIHVGGLVARQKLWIYNG